jgi:hypothetical protein
MSQHWDALNCEHSAARQAWSRSHRDEQPSQRGPVSLVSIREWTLVATQRTPQACGAERRMRTPKSKRLKT